MDKSDKITEVIEAPWAQWQQTLKTLRTKVFIEEQKVPIADEWDDYDLVATHFLALSSHDSTPIGTARLLPNGKITRMAVLKSNRNKGAGTALLNTAITAARKKELDKVFLDAQIDAQPFYEKHQFTAEGDTFLDAGIVHIHMWLKLF